MRYKFNNDKGSFELHFLTSTPITLKQSSTEEEGSSSLSFNFPEDVEKLKTRLHLKVFLTLFVATDDVLTFPVVFKKTCAMALFRLII